jgi:hypothetical protein
MFYPCAYSDGLWIFVCPMAERPDCAVASKPGIFPAILLENILAGIMPVGILNIYQ